MERNRLCVWSIGLDCFVFVQIDGARDDSYVLWMVVLVQKILLFVLLGVDFRPDVVGDGLGDSDRQFRVFQHDVAFGNDEQISGVELWLDLINHDEVAVIGWWHVASDSESPVAVEHDWL